MLPPRLSLCLLLTPCLAGAQSAPAVRYTALSDAARASGQLALYDAAPVRAGSLRLGAYTLRYRLPRAARAYDVIPVRYTLSQPAGPGRAAVEAVAFEDARRAKGRPLYDLALPGEMGVKVEYMGSVSADLLSDRYIPLTADPKTAISPFPPYRRDQPVRSSTVRAAPVVWFRFRLTNTGDTVLDPEGFGACFAEPWLMKVGPDGKTERIAGTLNSFERFHAYLYPGQSADFWINFYVPSFGESVRGLREGEYRLDYRLVYRYHREYNWGINIWTGAEFARLEVPIRVTRTGGATPVRAVFRATDVAEKMPGYVEAFEEFMTAFRIHPPVESETEREGVVYLQVAPWTKHVALKLVLTDPKRIAVARAPLHVTGETLAIRRNPGNPMVIERDGREEPVFVAMFLPGMRSGFQLGPWPEKHLEARLKEMKALGVNVISNSAGSWWIPEITGRKGVELHSASYKHFYDVLMRRYGMKALGWSVYPPSGRGWYDHAGPLLGRDAKAATGGSGYGQSDDTVDMGDPLVPEVIAAWAVYNHARWGDYWLTTKDGRVPIEMEDTWGWMRDDINVRYSVGRQGLARFRAWLRAKYGSVAQANAAWGSAYASFEEIDPEKDQGEEGDGLPHRPVYNRPENVFRDWSPAMEDFDRFRTELRMEILRKANALIQRKIPGGEISVRTEGANLVIPGDARSDSMHLRHVFYSQRRNAMVFDVVRRSGTLHFYSDYTTLPYTVAEWRRAMREMVAAGVVPMFLPQFDHMRDILLNPHYGREYRAHYNLDAPRKGMMIHALTAAYPWWKATYEEGGAPGIIWDDYGCDGFATETQKRELRLLRDHFDRMTTPAPGP